MDIPKEELDKYIPSLGPKSARSVLPRPDENSPPPKKKQKVNEDTLQIIYGQIHEKPDDDDKPKKNLRNNINFI